MFESRLIITVRYVETDQMGIVHHSNYFPYFEAGRTDFFKQIGKSYGELELQGILLPLYNCSCNFIKGAKYEDEIEIITKISSLSPVRIIFSYRVVLKNSDVLIAEGETCHAFVDNNFKPINLKKKNQELFMCLQKFI